MGGVKPATWTVFFAVAMFAGSVVFAAAVLPDPVAVYLGPANQPDVMYEVWQFLTLLAVGAGVSALAFAALARSISGVIAAFMPGREAAGSSVGAAVAAWVLTWFTSLLWLTIWLGNDDHYARSLYELLLSLVGVAGIPVVTILVLRGRSS